MKLAPGVSIPTSPQEAIYWFMKKAIFGGFGDTPVPEAKDIKPGDDQAVHGGAAAEAAQAAEGVGLDPYGMSVPYEDQTSPPQDLPFDIDTGMSTP